MTKNSLSNIRKEFLDFFSKRSHDIIPSSSLVPNNDESLLFTNAGMVQFKNIFTGLSSPPHSKKAVTAQKCVRAGGKHNDLENVGLTKRHHTFFEMLGNFSFGEYFKDDAIHMAWELITKNYQIDKNKLLVTVYQSDEEAFNIWKKVSGLSESKILKIGTKDNFWEMGDSGPCGPCSEIFYDHGDKLSGGLPGSDNEGDRYVEIWNLVFMQFNKKKNGKNEELPKPSIDTGMGIERVAAVLQGTPDNYETDIFRNIINFIKDTLDILENSKTKIPLRILSDHLRSVSFLISDGVLPSNEGRGYVLRRILRRAIRHLYNLNIKNESFYKLIPGLINEMGNHYSELITYKDLIKETVRTEEEKFLLTIDKGLKILEEENTKSRNSKIFSGKIAFKLYDTFGFPLDLTQDVLKSSNKIINMKEFDLEMEKQKENSKKSWKGNTDNTSEVFWNKLSENVSNTKFIGYEKLETYQKIKKIIFKNKEVKRLELQGEIVSIIFDETPFYPEGGGQVGDTGVIENKNFKFEVIDTLKRADKIIEHVGKIITGEIEIGYEALLKVNQFKREKTTAHHSATHLLHASLREKIGKHVTQKGSLVSENKLRFDISHNSSISNEMLNKIENEINSQVFRNLPVRYSILDRSEAIKKGAMAIFGEKYGDKVRVVEMGADKNNNDNPYSIELCGGTHVKRTGDIGLIKIISEGSLASGIRRIEAVVGALAINEYHQIENIIQKISEKLKTNKNLLEEKITKIVEDKKDLEKKLKNKVNDNNPTDIELEKVMCKNIQINSAILAEHGANDLKVISDKILKDTKDKLSLLISTKKNKVTLVIGISNNLQSTYNAVDLIRNCTPLLGGKGGGGKPTLAQGGGSKPENAEKVLKFLAEKFN